MLTHPPRTARLVLVTPDGNVVGSLRPVSVSTPWWQEVELVVRAVHERYGIEVTILRLLETELESFPGGGVTYLAEVAQSVPAEPWNGILDEQPLRQAYARPGGPAADLAWAASALRERGLLRTGPAVQVRTWNLSSIWRIPVDGQTVWLKVVPPFFAHEGPLLARLAGERVPIVLAQDGGRSLLAEIAGDDQVAATLPVLMEMVTLLVDLQRSWASRTDELLKLGLPDWRASALRVAIPAIIDRTTDQLTTGDRATLSHFVNTLPDRLAELATCGLPDTLVHGDFWPGNVRGNTLGLTLHDWGDSGVGHPLLDQTAFLDRIPSGAVDAIKQHWVHQWRAAVPGSDPARALVLLGPVAAARQALVYQHFLDCIEPAEHPYHRGDPAERLCRTAMLVRAESNGSGRCSDDA